VYIPENDKWIDHVLGRDQNSRKIDIVMKRFHESKLLLHPLAAGELSFDEIVT